MADTKGLVSTCGFQEHNTVNGQRTTALSAIESKEPAFATTCAAIYAESTREENSQGRILFHLSEDAFLYILKETFRKNTLSQPRLPPKKNDQLRAKNKKMEAVKRQSVLRKSLHFAKIFCLTDIEQILILRLVSRSLI